jgi:hypothetical protein
MVKVSAYVVTSDYVNLQPGQHLYRVAFYTSTPWAYGPGLPVVVFVVAWRIAQAVKLARRYVTSDGTGIVAMYTAQREDHGYCQQCGLLGGH